MVASFPKRVTLLGRKMDATTRRTFWMPIMYLKRVA